MGCTSMLRTFTTTALVVTLGLAGAARAHPVVYHFTGTASGDLNGDPFSGASFDIRAHGDTSAVVLLPTPKFEPDTWDNFPASLTVQLSGHSVLTVTDPGYVFDSQDVTPTQGLAGIGTVSGSATSVDFLYLLGPAILKTYKLVTSLAPVGGLALLVNQNGPAQLSTNKGVLTFASVQDLMFSASLAPEPQTWAMMILGLAGIGAAARRRRAAA